MNKEEIIEQLDAMEREAIKLINKGEPKEVFLYGISEEAAKMAGKNLKYTSLIVEEAKIRIERIAAYKEGK